jgi:hypothetical protein
VKVSEGEGLYFGKFPTACAIVDSSPVLLGGVVKGVLRVIEYPEECLKYTRFQIVDDDWVRWCSSISSVRKG